MSAVASGHDQQPIIIVRRHADHEEGHHGGVWKIAFADFMTAMMCFFLVMWLINAANEQTKASVASYFNPVKLIDRNSARKGLEDIGDGPNANGMDAKQAELDAAQGGADGEGTGGNSGRSTVESPSTAENADSALFADPYAVLAEIAAETGTRQNMSDKGDGGAQDSGPATGASGGEAYRDPFAPDFWSQEVAVPVAQASAEHAPSKAGKQSTESAKETAEAEEAPAPPPAPLEKTAAEISEALHRAFKPDDKAAEGISVAASDRGVVISVTDSLDFGMFEVGSAMPERALVLAMDKIGAAIRERGGTISIEGHTDARPFKGGGYDNWRLSTARAQAAYHMLVRAGLDERRIMSVSGFADRRPKLLNDPFAAANRRIEILLELPKVSAAVAGNDAVQGTSPAQVPAAVVPTGKHKTGSSGKKQPAAGAGG